MPCDGFASARRDGKSMVAGQGIDGHPPSTPGIGGNLDPYFQWIGFLVCQVKIDGDLFHHLLDVCRAKEGDLFEVISGDGWAYLTRLEKIGKKSLRIENIVDTSLLGGVRLKIGNRIYDGSLSGKLERLQRKLLS